VAFRPNGTGIDVQSGEQLAFLTAKADQSGHYQRPLGKIHSHDELTIRSYLNSKTRFSNN